MAKKYKIIIASILAGSGHNSAADLLAQILEKNENFEIIRYIHPSKSIDKQYNDMTKNSPIVHNFFVNHAPIITSDAITLSMIHFADNCIELVKKERPDCIICTHFTLAHWFKIAQWVTKIQYININWFLDYGDRTMGELPYNLYLRPDYSIALDKDAADSIARMAHQRKDHILISGYKAKQEFINKSGVYISKNEAKIKLKERFNTSIYSQLSADKTTIIIAGGGGGIIQKTKGFIKKLTNYQKKDISLIDKYQFLIICGQNEKFYKTILKQRKTKLSWQNIFPFGWLDPADYDIVQKACDYPILYGIAPATMHELMVNECVPLIVHRVRGDHEIRNIDFLADKKIGKFIKKDSILIKAIFSNRFTTHRENYLKRTEQLLQEEKDLLENFDKKILEIIEGKQLTIFKIYKNSFKLRFFSSFLTTLYQFVFYLRKFIYKLAGVFPWILKKFPIEI